MKVLFINANCGIGSTGRICTDLYSILKEQGHIAKIAYSHSPALGCDVADTYKIHGKMDYYMHNVLAKLADKTGFFSTIATEKLVNYIDKEDPDIIHLHNIHGYYINIEILFNYLKDCQKPVVWTLHDCWSFTGRCAYFDLCGCTKWINGCSQCEDLSSYPQSWFFDNCADNYRLKKQLFTQILPNLYLIPVSLWLESLLAKSFLKEANIQTIHNGIDLKNFHPYSNGVVADKYNIKGKKIVLGVASPWDARKGYNDFLCLRNMLDNRYAIIMVGLSSEQLKKLPDGIIGISRTSNVQQLAQIYSEADVFVNTTYSDNYPTVNLESIACGTPVITYNTGGSPEAIGESTGLIVPQGDLSELVAAIHSICFGGESSREACLKHALNCFDKYKCFNRYIDLYKFILNGISSN